MAIVSGTGEATPDYRGRLAPSPTGALHLGHVRTYMVAWLRARSIGGKLLLREEDLDPPRVVEGSADEIRRDLEWLGFDWDEGPDVGGPHAPYVQSQRHDLYERALGELRARGLVFDCTCSRKEIAASAPHGPSELGPRYPGTCHDRPSHPNRNASVRFRLDEGDSFQDAFFGEVDGTDWGGDFIVRRSDKLWAYQLAVVVDDIAMGITEVVRGADLLSSTPRQIALYRAFGAPVPTFLHVPLVLNAEGKRLSKRTGATGVAVARRAGLSKEQVIGHVAMTLGLTDTPFATLGGLAETFDMGRLRTTEAAIPLPGVPDMLDA